MRLFLKSKKDLAMVFVLNMADTLNNTPHWKISEFLLNLGTCWRCSLRFVRERKPEAYEVKVEEDQEPENKLTKISPCIVCLGILQDNFLNIGLDEVCQKIYENNYDSKTYSCMVSLPASVMLREHAVWLLVTDKYPEILSDAVKADHITSLKDVWKFVTTRTIEEKIQKQSEINTSPLQVQINLVYKNDEQECNCLVDISPEMFKKRYKQTRVYQHGIFSRSAIQNVLSTVSAEKFTEHFKLETPQDTFSYGEIHCSHTSIHIAGRYNKFSRTLCQTPWVIDGKKHMDSSIQEQICQHLEPFFNVQSCKFSSSGREDVDVRTLGKGRPFAVELINPRRTQCVQKEINALQQLINNSTNDISINDLQLVTKDQLLVLKEGEEDKTKNYAAVCVMLDGLPISEDELKKVDGITELVVMQKTPLRVLHRRSLAIRPKTVHHMKTEILPHLRGHFILRLKTQAGTYIKEFVHGDFNRSVPNLCTLLQRPVDIIALDVDHVELDWPPPVNYEN